MIVSDGGSTDGTIGILESLEEEWEEDLELVIVKGPKGRGAQQNLGAEQAKGSILAFLHADTWYIYMYFMFSYCLDISCMQIFIFINSLIDLNHPCAGYRIAILMPSSRQYGPPGSVAARSPSGWTATTTPLQNLSCSPATSTAGSFYGR